VVSKYESIILIEIFLIFPIAESILEYIGFQYRKSTEHPARITDTQGDFIYTLIPKKGYFYQLIYTFMKCGPPDQAVIKTLNSGKNERSL